MWSHIYLLVDVTRARAQRGQREEREEREEAEASNFPPPFLIAKLRK
jgi:hypothetical protein